MQTKVSMLAELWLRDVDESDRAIRTKITYRDVCHGALDANPVRELSRSRKKKQRRPSR